MNEFKGTPGPWETNGEIVRAKGSKTVADILEQDLYNKDIEAMANAHLIAAAPELLEALEKMIVFIQSNGIIIPAEVSTAPIGFAKQAIAKALNKTP